MSKYDISLQLKLFIMTTVWNRVLQKKLFLLRILKIFMYLCNRK